MSAVSRIFGHKWLLKSVVCVAMILLPPAAATADESNLPTTEQFHGALSACAAGLDVTISSDLIGSITNIYNGAKANGAAEFKAETKFLELFSEADRPKMYELYQKCILQILGSAVPNGKQTDFSSNDPTKLPQIPFSDVHVGGRLEPANDPTPHNSCDDSPRSRNLPPAAMIILVGDNTFIQTFPNVFVVISNGNCRPLTFRKSGDTIYINSSLFDEDGEEIVTIRDNNIVSLNGDNYRTTQSQNHSSISVVNKVGNELLYAKYLNKNTIRIRGVFGCKGRKPLVVKDNQPILGVDLRHSCLTDAIVGVAVP